VELFLKPRKYEFHIQEVEFLGFMIGIDRVQMDPAKVKYIIAWPAPRSPHNIRIFLGLANFYCWFIKNFSQLTASAHSLAEKGKYGQEI